MTPAHIAAIAIGWFIAGAITALIVGRFFAVGQPVEPEQGPRRLRHDSGHQRLERGRFSKGANQSNHGSASK